MESPLPQTLKHSTILGGSPWKGETNNRRTTQGYIPNPDSPYVLLCLSGSPVLCQLDTSGVLLSRSVSWPLLLPDSSTISYRLGTTGLSHLSLNLCRAGTKGSGNRDSGPNTPGPIRHRYEVHRLTCYIRLPVNRFGTVSKTTNKLLEVGSESGIEPRRQEDILSTWTVCRSKGGVCVNQGVPLIPSVSTFLDGGLS